MCDFAFINCCLFVRIFVDLVYLLNCFGWLGYFGATSVFLIWCLVLLLGLLIHIGYMFWWLSVCLRLFALFDLLILCV